MDEKKLIEELRKLAKQNLIDRDWYGISNDDIASEMSRILVDNKFGITK